MNLKKTVHAPRLLAPLFAGLCLCSQPAAAAPKGKTAPKSTAPAPAAVEPSTGDQKLSRYRRLLLPPMLLQDVTVEQAYARFTQAYQEAAALTGDTAEPLQLDLSKANTTARFNLITPLAPPEKVLRILAAMAGNRMTGQLPGYALTALDTTPRPEAKGTLAVAPDLAAKLTGLLGIAHLELGEPGDLPEIVKGLGIGGDTARISLSMGQLHHSGLSEADVNKLNLAANDCWISPMQLQMKVSMATLPASAASQLPGPMVKAGDYAAVMKKLAKLQGGELHTLPDTIALFGKYVDQQDLIQVPVPNADGKLTAMKDTGSTCTTRSKAAGLGFRTSVTYTTWDQGRQAAHLSKDVVIPDQGAVLITEKLPDGKLLVLIPHATLLDATGKPPELASR